ncbi:hypothetical protein A2397_05525 [Candidatus Amesbacteria bacterium RIFOXYB1_FULL_44_23]|uniref:Prepilin-type N-terminal cleavage/methylation domain-containing protein n=1 Tax=Candidatus Amesbacteria bacterium RIFOXYB1_FULL_44_23 TaxID=1797263 RepID=A0A1F4ZQZ6_9BACT|nr:MAG: hypothetical protein A2397_05525 [Candidatus Amesbacteria bacterium RIFOXYB1_FULL_44_23]
MKKGFTIVELLIYMGLLSILLVVLGGLFGSVLETQLETQSVSVIDQDNRFIDARLVYDVHRATDVITPAGAGQTSSFLSLNIGGSTYTYSVSNGQLQLTIAGNTQAVSSYGTQVSDFLVTRLGNPSGKPSLRFNYTLTGSITSLDQEPQVTYGTATATLR